MVVFFQSGLLSFGIPTEEIAIATGATDEIAGEEILSDKSRIRMPFMPLQGENFCEYLLWRPSSLKSLFAAEAHSYR